MGLLFGTGLAAWRDLPYLRVEASNCPSVQSRFRSRLAAAIGAFPWREPEVETEEEAARREAEHEQRLSEYEVEQERREEERKAEFDRQQMEYEAEQARATTSARRESPPSNASSNRLPCHSAPNRCASSFACSSTWTIASLRRWPTTSPTEMRTPNSRTMRLCWPHWTAPQTRS